jgi:hypothetical protein
MFAGRRGGGGWGELESMSGREQGSMGAEGRTGEKEGRGGQRRDEIKEIVV